MLCCGLFAGCKQKISEADYQVIPLPKQIDLNKDTPFALTKNTIIYYDEGDSLRREAEFLAEYLSDLMDRDFQIKPIEASTRTGVFLGVD